MNTLSVLVVVDALGALSSGTLMDNVYLVDSSRYLGSWQEGTDSLHTLCQDGQLIRWYATGVSPGSRVAITGFAGPMADQGICVPVSSGGADGDYWTGRVASRGSFASWPYVVSLALGGQVMRFSPYLKVD
ncbi:alpha-pore-forming tripartite toxin MakABE regulator [Massilia niastensis]|uniref:alpha-pore-forming tripartite toxin MakABE regulator n=1 Tax=Massilia niastensis TaxID=544911 RepID=UPI000377DD3F|nr:hypothetical protein [Massilia niastensis]